MKETYRRKRIENVSSHIKKQRKKEQKRETRDRFHTEWVKVQRERLKKAHTETE